MDLVEQMRTFVRVVDAGSLSAAARTRRLSLAAVSRQLGALEQDLETTLIVRTTRRLQITPSGQRWYAHCARILRDLDDARADVADTGEPTGRITVSAPITLGTYLVAPRLAQLAREHPALEIDLRLEDHVIDLVGDAVDIAVRGGFDPPDSSAVIAHPFASFRRVVVASPAYLRAHGVPQHPRELARHQGILQHSVAPALAAWRFERAGEIVDVAPRGRLRCTAPLALRDWAIAGAGIALLPDWLVPRRSRTLRRLLPDWQTPVAHAWLLHRIELRGAPRIRAAVAALAAPAHARRSS